LNRPAERSAPAAGELSQIPAFMRRISFFMDKFGQIELPIDQNNFLPVEPDVPDRFLRPSPGPPSPFPVPALSGLPGFFRRLKKGYFVHNGS